MESLVTITTLAGLKELESYISDKEFIALDTETTGVSKEDEIIGFSICADVSIAYYVVISYWDVKQQKLVYLETKEGTKTFFQKLVGKSLILQNAPFDCGMVEDNFCVKLMSSVHTDTLLLGHLLNENRMNGLKERATELYGEDSTLEQREMKESVYRNGGVLTKEKYELYKADMDLMAKYGAKDAILTLKVFYHDVEELYAQGLDKFFYEDETMPLLRGPTYDLNRTGLAVDPAALSKLRGELEADCLEAKAFIYKEIEPLVKDKYKSTGKNNTFNINSSKQLSWLLYFRLGHEFNKLTDGGRELCKELDIKVPYAPAAKRAFLEYLKVNKGKEWQKAKWDWKKKKWGRPKKIGNPWDYLACGKESIEKFSDKYKWAKTLLKYAKDKKILNTYVLGIQSRMKYNIIRPSFLQHGTTSGRYSSKNPNFMNLPRDDRRIKNCIVSRKGKLLIGADYSQLEPRVFASFSQDERLMSCFEKGEDFYSVVGVDTFNKSGCSLIKDNKDSFANLYEDLRQISKVVALSATYGTTAFKMAPTIKKSPEEAQEIIYNYFRAFPSVHKFMLDTHEQVKTEGVVYNLFGRPRRIPKALDIKKIYGNTKHADLPYMWRNLLNLAVNHPIQSTGASVINRASIAFWKTCQSYGLDEVKIVMQIHDELIIECPEELAESVAKLLKFCMEETVKLPGVRLQTDPKISNNLSKLK